MFLHIFLSSGPRTELPTEYLLGMVEARSANVKSTNTHTLHDTFDPKLRHVY